MAPTATNDDGFTESEVDTAFEVLEQIRQDAMDHGRSDRAEVANDAQYLIHQYRQGSDWSDDYETYQPGDTLRDTNPPYWSSDDRVVVEEMTSTPASEYEIDVPGSMTVAGKNPDEPRDAPVVLAKYVDGNDKAYAFPATRLETLKSP